MREMHSSMRPFIIHIYAIYAMAFHFNLQLFAYKVHTNDMIFHLFSVVCVICSQTKHFFLLTLCIISKFNVFALAFTVVAISLNELCKIYGGQYYKQLWNLSYGTLLYDYSPEFIHIPLRLYKSHNFDHFIWVVRIIMVELQIQAKVNILVIPSSPSPFSFILLCSFTRFFCFSIFPSFAFLCSSSFLFSHFLLALFSAPFHQFLDHKQCDIVLFNSSKYCNAL